MTDADGDRAGLAPAERAGIEVECLSCGRIGAFDAADRRVSGAPLSHLTRRFRCSACGSGAVKAKAVRRPGDLARRMRARMDAAREPD